MSVCMGMTMSIARRHYDYDNGYECEKEDDMSMHVNVLANCCGKGTKIAFTKIVVMNILMFFK